MRRSIALMAVFTLVAAACGDSDGDDTVAACDAFVAAHRAIDIDEDLEAGIAALEDFVAAAPGDVASEVEPIIPLLQEDPEAALESEEVAAGETVFDAYGLDNCADQRVDLKAFDYAYGTVPEELDAGRVVFNLTNESEAGEFHEALVLRKRKDATGSAHDILAAAIEGPISVEATMNALGEFGFDAVGFVEPDGDTSDVFAADLDPGDYIVACLLPVNSPEQIESYFGGGEIEGDRHFDKGMYGEFTVS